MTRDFNKQYREDNHSFRGRPSDRYQRDERSSQQSHARPNRASVDRAWENGASRPQPDYRSRNTSERPPRGNTQYRDQQSRNTSYDGTRNHDGRYQGNRRDQDQPRSRGYRSDDAPRTNGFRPRPYRDDRSSNNAPYRRSENNDRSRPSQFDGDRPSYNRSAPRSFDRGPRERSSDRGSSYGHNSSNNRSGAGSTYSHNFQSRIGEHTPDNRYGSAHHERRSFNDRGQAQRRPSSPRYTSQEEHSVNPRFLSRPEMRQAHERNSAREQAQFEGDYEQFNTEEDFQPREDRDFNQYDDDADQARSKARSKYKTRSREIHVTRLPDGRVLKGSRPAQRKNAQFWTNINTDTENLLDQVQTPQPEQTSNPTPKADRKTANTNSAKKRKEVKKPRSNGPKPSQKGFKWPDAAAAENPTTSE